MSLIEFILSLFRSKKEDNVSHFKWKKGEKFQLSKYFISMEFECKCTVCEDQTISKELVTLLTKVREAFADQILVTSGYRCPAHQEYLRKQGLETAVGVSQHELGNAADIAIRDLSKMILLKDLCEKEFEAVGVAKTFLHVDTRKGKTRRWTYGS